MPESTFKIQQYLLPKPTMIILITNHKLFITPIGKGLEVLICITDLMFFMK